jgi:hypothetical protein
LVRPVADDGVQPVYLSRSGPDEIEVTKMRWIELPDNDPDAALRCHVSIL